MKMEIENSIFLKKSPFEAGKSYSRNFQKSSNDPGTKGILRVKTKGDFLFRI